jgi:hypothetical protein
MAPDHLGNLETLVRSDPTSLKSIEEATSTGLANFKRTVKMGFDNTVTVLKADNDVRYILPGTHKLSDVVSSSLDSLPFLTPRYTEIQGIKWVSNMKTGKGSLQFPPNFNVASKIEVETGSNVFVGYYGCSITNTRNDDNVTLGMRHSICDFSYSENYLQEWVLNKNGNNGAGIERHNFSHVDIPKVRESGLMLLGKFKDEDETILHLTFFHMPQGHCLFIPGGTIHTNDYLKGTWRTMLSDEAPIDYCYLEQGDVRFHFHFDP